MNMKRLPLPLLVAASLLAFGPARVFADPAEIEQVIALLQQAQAAQNPVPLLQKAHATLKEFDPVPDKISGAPRKNAGNRLGAHDHKRQAMEAIADAIKVAKEGGDAKPKIRHAVAMAHKAGDLKR